MEGSCPALDRSFICTRFLGAENNEWASAAALERSASAAEKTVTSDAFNLLGRPKTSLGKLKSVCYRGETGSQLASFEKDGKTDNLLGAWTDSDLLAVSRSLNSRHSLNDFIGSLTTLS